MARSTSSVFDKYHRSFERASKIKKKKKNGRKEERTTTVENP